MFYYKVFFPFIETLHLLYGLPSRCLKLEEVIHGLFQDMANDCLCIQLMENGFFFSLIKSLSDFAHYHRDKLMNKYTQKMGISKEHLIHECVVVIMLSCYSGGPRFDSYPSLNMHLLFFCLLPSNRTSNIAWSTRPLSFFSKLSSLYMEP